MVNTQSLLFLVASVSVAFASSHAPQQRHHRRANALKSRLNSPFDNKTSPVKRADIVLPAGWSYIGCVNDPGNARVLPTQVLQGTISVSSCAALCANSQYDYAGMEYGTECWCGNVPNGLSMLPESSCSMPCTGDSTQKCGNGYVLSLYGKKPATQITYTDLGCYSDQYPDRTLPDYSTSSGSMTPSVCQSTCSANGYPYAGIEAGNECWCAASLTRGAKVSDSECSTPCTGDASKTCGGGWRLNLYGPASATTSTSTAAPSSTGVTFTKVGCYTDQQDRTLPDTTVSSNTMTPQSCFATCKNYKYAGVEAGNECYCSNTAPTVKGTAVAESECANPCTGDATQSCGGGWKIMVYTSSPSGTSTSTTATSSATSGVYNSIGCFIDASDRILPGGTASNTQTNTPATCIASCKASNYAYAGVEAGSECYCSNTSPFVKGTKVGASECNTPCTGDSSKTCGGGWRIDVYGPTAATSTTMTSTSTSSAATSTSTGFTSTVMGCYADSFDRLLPEYSFNSQSMTPSLCFSQCYPLGYTYAGVESGSECWCSGTSPLVRGTKVADSECSTNCAGDSGLKCGGGWRLNVFSLTSGTPTSTSTSSSVTASPTGVGYVKLGCYTDQASPRTLPTTVSGSPDLTGQTIEGCNAKCKALNLPYAGTQTGSECWCGWELPSSTLLVNDSECNIACTGNSGTKCGGAYRLSVQYNPVMDGWECT